LTLIASKLAPTEGWLQIGNTGFFLTAASTRRMRACASTPFGRFAIESCN
jgi:hypothetical protein